MHIVYLSIKGNSSLAVVKSHLVTRSKQTEGSFMINDQRFALTRITFDGHDRVIRGIARDFWLLSTSPERAARLREGADYEWVHPRKGRTMLDMYVDRESKTLFADAQTAVLRALGRHVHAEAA
jgi:hypothetical protein